MTELSQEKNKTKKFKNHFHLTGSSSNKAGWMITSFTLSICRASDQHSGHTEGRRAFNYGFLSDPATDRRVFLPLSLAVFNFLFSSPPWSQSQSTNVWHIINIHIHKLFIATTCSPLITVDGVQVRLCSLERPRAEEVSSQNSQLKNTFLELF